MKRWLIVLCLSVAGSQVLAAVPLRIVIDPGHGGKQQGALGPKGVLEKDIALAIAQRVGESLTRQDQARVFYTRQTDIDLALSERVALANERKPDLFISIHANSMPTRRQRTHAEGIETFFLSARSSNDDARLTADYENSDLPQRSVSGTVDPLSYILADLRRTENHADSSRLAYAVHQRLISSTQAPDRGVQQAPFYVLTGVDAPAILVEVGFISNPRECRKLRDPSYQQKIATAMVDGILAFVAQMREQEKGIRVASPSR
jgi:N-acetylmuramoyl-L-alanine amidase